MLAYAILFFIIAVFDVFIVPIGYMQRSLLTARLLSVVFLCLSVMAALLNLVQ